GRCAWREQAPHCRFFAARDARAALAIQASCALIAERLLERVGQIAGAATGGEEACTRALSEWDVRRREPERQRTRAGPVAHSLLPQPLISCRHEPSRKPRDTGRLLEELGKAQRASDGIVRSGEAAANRGAEPVHQVTDVDVLHEPLLRFWHEHVLCAREREPRYPVG